MISEQLLHAVQDIARDAGNAILSVYHTDFQVEDKADKSPLTEADLTAHRIIGAGLRALEPSLPILSEEGSDAEAEDRRSWSHFWLVDPLDGTKEFVNRNGEFTVNIALIEDGEPVLGVVHAPALGTSYIAARGIGAFREDSEGRRPIATRSAPERPAFVVSRSHRDEALEALLARLPEHEAVSTGSSLKFCLVAEGVADLYPRTGPTSEWDTGAGQCVAEIAGARVLRLPDLGPMRYNERDTLLNPGFVVIGDPAAAWADQLGG
ncbi:3'(2'),5'-bisphosphate nucleotidase CysQ [Algiphilus aromaticivorans]|uniref:3'(2'),5'-bisphosphate nucleotidase CysQ n=1 Tax=Algiphilus aromaticivorans TaxID=382454 RepID=UPI0005C19C17|nr:3'(2'),5'-bisphosphate nucleotidase CysQ [Algiphilus aromaticivorans]